MCAAHPADTIGRQCHAHSPYDGHLPQTALSACQHSGVNRATAKKNEDKRAESFGQERANKGQHVAPLLAVRAGRKKRPPLPLEASSARRYIAWFDFLA